MITISEWANVTRISGLAAYTLATVASAIAWSRFSQRHAALRLPVFLTFLNLALTFDIAFDLRWRFNKILQDAAVSHHLYDARRAPQALALVLLLIIFLSVVALVLRAFRGHTGATVAVSGAVLAIACWWVEVISLHQVDRIMYHFIGPFMFVSFIWWLSALLTAAGILAESRRLPDKQRYIHRRST